MDPRRHGKQPLSSQTSKEEEKVQEFDAYASWSSETDMTEMVSALAQVMGTANQNPPITQSTSFPLSNFDTKDQPQPHPPPDKGLLAILTCFNSSSIYVIYSERTLIGLFLEKKKKTHFSASLNSN